VLSIPLLFAAFSEKSSPYGIPIESSHMGLNQGYSGAGSVHMRNDQEIGLRWMTHESQV
jgi:hypothetical protein